MSAEIVIGYDGIVIANAKSGKPMALNREMIFKAIAKTVPRDGKLVANPYKKWSDVDPSLPKEDIVVFGPASNHGTRDALVELVMDEACAKFPEIKALTGDAKKVACEAVREDGGYIEVSENYTVTLQKLSALPYAVGVLTFSYLDQNGDKIQGATVEGATGHLRQYRHRQISVVASAVLLCKKRPCRRDPGHQGIHRRIHLGKGLEQGRLSGPEGSDCRAGCTAQVGSRQGQGTAERETVV